MIKKEKKGNVVGGKLWCRRVTEEKGKRGGEEGREGKERKRRRVERRMVKKEKRNALGKVHICVGGRVSKCPG
jgi:hypothetical protein